MWAFAKRIAKTEPLFSVGKSVVEWSPAVQRAGKRVLKLDEPTVYHAESPSAEEDFEFKLTRPLVRNDKARQVLGLEPVSRERATELTLAWLRYARIVPSPLTPQPSSCRRRDSPPPVTACGSAWRSRVWPRSSAAPRLPPNAALGLRGGARGARGPGHAGGGAGADGAVRAPVRPLADVLTDKWHWPRYARARRRLRRVLLEFAPDLVHSNDLPTHQIVGDAARRWGSRGSVTTGSPSRGRRSTGSTRPAPSGTCSSPGP